MTVCFRLTSTRKAIGSSHPLEVSQKQVRRVNLLSSTKIRTSLIYFLTCLQHFQNELSLEMTMLRNNQGLHAPMRLAMELKCADKIGRHPFLPSSSIMRDVILGREEHIGLVFLSAFIIIVFDLNYQKINVIN